MNKCLRIGGIAAVMLLMSFCLLWSVALASAQTGCGGEVLEASNLLFEAQVVELVNQTRAEQALPPLKLNPTLSNAARYLAGDMVADQYFAHDTYDRIDDQLVRVCKWSERIQQYYTGALAENVAAGYQSPVTVMHGWLESEGHRTNILGDYRELGVGYADGYWVQDFGLHADSYPLIINREAITTAALEVELYIYGEWDTMRLRNDGGEWSEWQPFQNQLTWRLPSQSGTHLVEAELQNATSTVTSSDEIDVMGAQVTNSESSDTATSLLFLPVLHR